MNETKLYERFEMVAWDSMIKVSKRMDKNQTFRRITSRGYKFIIDNDLSLGLVTITAAVGLFLGVLSGFILTKIF